MGKVIEKQMKDVFGEFSLVDIDNRKEEYIDLFKVYCDELSKDDPQICRYNFTELAKENLVNSSDRPMFIMKDKAIVGFVVFMDETDEVGNDDCHTYIGEIYVKPKYRKKGIASRLVCKYLDSLEYDSGFCYIRNSSGEKFWLRLLDGKGYRYDIVKEDEVRDFVHVHLR